MSNYAYEALGRVTWFAGKRVARKKINAALENGKSHRPSKTVGIIGVLVLIVGGIAAAEVAARQMQR